MSLDGKRGFINFPSLNSAIECIIEGVAQAFYKEIPTEIISNTRKRLPEEFLTVIDEFNLKFVPYNY